MFVGKHDQCRAMSRKSRTPVEGYLNATVLKPGYRAPERVKAANHRIGTQLSPQLLIFSHDEEAEDHRHTALIKGRPWLGG